MDKYIIRKYGIKNLKKYKKNKRYGPEETKRRFLEKYPYANIKKFMFGVSVDKNADISSYNVNYRINDVRSVSIKSEEFLNNEEYRKDLNKDVLWLSPWNVGGKVQKFSPNSSYSEKITDVKIYVSKNEYFMSNFENFDIKNTASNEYESNSYLASLFAAYVATYLCGISAEHLTENPKTPKIITSLAKYHLYYQMKIFLTDPSKMKKYLTNDVKKIVMDNKPTKPVWEKKFHQGKEQIGVFLSRQSRGTVRNAKPVLSEHGGQVGINYEKLVRRTIVSLEDYKVFIAERSDGLTKTGQLLFQQSVESYVYCVLGAQAKTRWPIVESGARSLQTQEVFRKLVNDTSLETDHTVTLSNMRGAIKTTNVVLDTAVSPGIILVPSRMIILDKMIEGYNNVLTIATKGMRFGRNDGINYFVHRITTLPEDAPTTTKTKTVPTVTKTPLPGKQEPLDMFGIYTSVTMALLGTAIAWMI